MVATDNETVREVCADISYLTGDLADRILAAHEREMAAKDAEIERLKAALKPVMECASKSAEGSMPNYIGCWEAVREAQGGEK